MRRHAGFAAALLALLLAGGDGVRASDGSAAALLDSLDAAHHASRPDRVDSLAAPAIAAARARGDSLTLGALLLARGRTRAAFGLARGAEPDLREAVALAGAAGDTAARLRGLRWLSVAVGRQGRGGEALRLYRDLEWLARAAGDSVHLGWSWIGRAYAHYLEGRSDSSATLYARAGGVLARAGVARGAVWAWNGEGLARRQAGDFTGAAVGFRRALEMARASDDALNEALALNYLGRLELRFGDPGLAEGMLARAAEIHAAHRHHREGLLPRIDMARARVLAGRPEAAASLLDSVLGAAREHGLADLEVLATGQLADVLLDLDRPGAAAAACRGMLARGELPSTMAGTELRLRLARALADRDSVAAALDTLAAVTATGSGAQSLELTLAALRGRLLLDQGRARAAARTLQPAADPARTAGGDALRIPVLTALGRARLALRETAAALESFDEAVALWDAARGLPADPEWRERRGAEAGELFAHAVAARIAHPVGDALAARQAAAYALLQRYKARTLLERMLGPARPLPAAAAPATLEEVGGALGPGEVLLDAVQADELTVIFAVTADTVLAAMLPGAGAMATGLRRLETALASPAVRDPAPAMRLAASLLDGVPEPLRARLRGARRVIWCPDGSLHRLPLALLTGADGWLAPGCELTRLPAATLLVRRLPDAALDRTSVLALHGAAPGDAGAMPGAEAETRWLAARLEATRRYSGLEALAAEGVDWRHAGVLHLAAHVDLERRQPWQSAVALGPGSRGRLRAGDVVGDTVAAQLVFLSGCRSAGSDVVGGEGLLGLGAGFLAAGAPAVVATLWDVDDHVTARFVADFYGALADGATAAGALAAARQACRARPETAAPRHWAGFVLVGDGGRRVPVQWRREWWPVALLLAGLAVGAMIMGRQRVPRS